MNKEKMFNCLIFITDFWTLLQASEGDDTKEAFLVIYIFGRHEVLHCVLSLYFVVVIIILRENGSSLDGPKSLRQVLDATTHLFWLQKMSNLDPNYLTVRYDRFFAYRIKSRYSIERRISSLHDNRLGFFDVS